jgi:Icc-related predicted phosphoesterase
VKIFCGYKGGDESSVNMDPVIHPTHLTSADMAATTKSNEIYPISTFINDLSITFTSTPEASPSSDFKSISARRLVIVGDVHGSLKTLEALLELVKFDKSTGDVVIFVGDLVNKGPDSGGVIDLIQGLGGRSVRGNHDNAVLNASERLRRQASAADSPEAQTKSESTLTAEKLSSSQVDYLASLPLAIRLKLTPALPGIQEVVVVHAGLVPGTRLEEQSAHAVMHMRSLEGHGDVLVPMEEAGEQGWIEEWDRWQGEQGAPTMVVFGHDAKRRMQRGKHALGLDTACVYGGKLSAWVVGDGEANIMQVDCVDGAS